MPPDRILLKTAQGDQTSLGMVEEEGPGPLFRMIRHVVGVLVKLRGVLTKTRFYKEVHRWAWAKVSGAWLQLGQAKNCQNVSCFSSRFSWSSHCCIPWSLLPGRWYTEPRSESTGRKKMLNSLLSWLYFKWSPSSPVCLLLLQIAQVVTSYILSSDYRCISWNRQGGAYLFHHLTSID